MTAPAVGPVFCGPQGTIFIPLAPATTGVRFPLGDGDFETFVRHFADPVAGPAWDFGAFASVQ